MLPLTLLALVPLAFAARSLPNPMIGGYAGNGECDAAVTAAVQNGVNVILWFSLNLSPSQPPSGGPNLTCVAEVKRNLTASGLATTHMISIGGWDAPHPVNGSAAAFYAQWKAWNEQGGEALFDGIDWDLEGNDNATSPWNALALDTLAIVGGMSQLAKAEGYLVTLVPPESYFDVSTSLFDRGLTHAYPEPWHPEFLYHGHNGYAYIYTKYGGAATFDAVSIQLYETFAHADYNISILHQRPAEYLEAWVRALSAGWTVDFASAPELGFPTQQVALPPSQLVIGLANGWAGGAGAPRALLIMPEEVGVAWAALGPQGRPRGAVFWDISSEGAVPSGQSSPLYLAAGLNAFMGIR
jgi:hypothetical protein